MATLLGHAAGNGGYGQGFTYRSGGPLLLGEPELTSVDDRHNVTWLECQKEAETTETTVLHRDAEEQSKQVQTRFLRFSV